MNHLYRSFLVLIFIILGNISISAAISATITGTTSVCVNNTNPNITFTGTGGTAPYTFTYKINGGSNFTVTTISGNSVTVAVPTSVTGTFIYSLVNVSDVSSVITNQVGSATVQVESPPVIDFTFPTGQCFGSSVEFTSSVTGTGNYTYAWNFDDTSISTDKNPSHLFTASGNSTQTFNVTLKVTSSAGCSQSITKPVTLPQAPDLTITSNISSDVYNGQPVFKTCSSASADVTFYNSSTTSASNTNYSIDWGDGTSSMSATAWTSANHTYSLGIWSLIYTVTGQNSCTKTTTYKVFIGSNPAVSLGNPGNTDICSSTTLTFPITGTENNPPGTTYTVTFSDGSAPQVFNHPPPASVSHTFTKSSCGFTSPSGSPNSFYARIVASNPCGAPSVGTVEPINVSTPPVSSFTLPAPSTCTNTSICLTGAPQAATDNCLATPKSIWTITPSAGVILSSGTLGNDTADPTNPNTWLTGSNSICLQFSIPGKYAITLKEGNHCGIDTKTDTLCVEAPLVPKFTLSNNAGCAPLSVNTTNTTDITAACEATTYQWDITYTPDNCGTTSAYTYTGGTSVTSISPSFNFTNPGTYTLSLSATNICGTQSITHTVTVKQPPTATINAIADSCGMATITPSATINSCAPASSTLTYAWSFPGGNPASANTANPGSIAYTTPGTYTVSLIVGNECGSSPTATRTFAVKPIPAITNTTLSQTICSGTSTTLVNLTADLPGTTFSWSATATAGITGYALSGNTNTLPIQTISTTGTTTGTVTYTITPSLGGCSGTPIKYVVSVNPTPIFTGQPVSSTVCQGGIPTTLSVSYTNGTGTPSYQWYQNTINSTASGVSILNATNPTYDPSTSVVGTTYYFCIITLPNPGCSTMTSNIATVIVTAKPTISTQPTPTQNICTGGTIASPLSVAYSGGTGSVTYQWYSNTTATNSGGTAIAGATGANYTPPVFSTTGSYYYYVEIMLSGNNCGAVYSNVAEIVVVNDPVVDSQPTATQTICQGSTPTDLSVTVSGGVGTYLYQWYSNMANNTSTGTAIAGATNATFTPSTAATGTLYYYCAITQTGAGCNAISATAEVIVKPAPIFTSQPASSAVCQGGIPTLLSVTYINGIGTPSYQWYSNTANVNSGGIPIAGAINDNFAPPSSAVGTVYYYCVITLPSGGCSSIVSNTATVIINSAVNISSQPTSIQNLCVGGSIPNPLTVSYTGGAGTASYQWYSNTTNSNSGGTAIAGATNVNYTPPVFAATGTYYYYVGVTTSGNGCGAVFSNPAEVVVVADPVITAQPNVTQSLCQGSMPTDLSVTLSGGIGTFSYQWYANAANNNSTGTAITGATNSTYTPSSASTGTTYYYCVVSQTGVGCNALSATAEVIIKAAPIFTGQPVSSTVCQGVTPTPLSVSFINGVGTPNYQWYSNTTNTTVGGSLISGATSNTYNPPAIVIGTTYYYCIVTLPSGGCSSIISNIASVTVNENPVIASKNSLICSGGIFNVAPTSASGDIVPTGTTYTWLMPTINPAGAISGASAQLTPQTAISQALINTTNNPATVTYTVTPTSGTCAGANFQVVVTVNPSITPNITLQNSNCFGANNGSIQTNIVGGVPFSTGAPYIISWTGPNGFTSNSNSITGLAPGVYTLAVNDAGGCPFTNSYTITEPADIIITTDNRKDISCFGANNGAISISVTGGAGVYTYAWTKNGTAFASTEDIANLSPGVYKVSVNDANGCVPKTATYTITEPTVMSVSVVSTTNEVCYGDATGAINIKTSGGTPIETSPGVFDYIYSWTGPSGFTSTNQNLSSIPAGTYTLKITDKNGCFLTLSVNITQPTELLIKATTTPITCYGANNASISLAISGGTAPYQIKWSNFATGTVQTNLSAGNYQITITDAVNCQKVLNIIIPEAPIFAITPTIKGISCYGAHDGSINLNFVGGKSPVSLVWSDNSTSGATRNNLGAGNYTVYINDATPCNITQTFVILEPQQLVINANITHALDCNNTNSGAINVLVAGGNQPYTFLWSNGATTQNLTNIPAGNYLVTVTDAKGCTQTGQYTVTRPLPITIGVNTVADFDCATKSVKAICTAQVTGGVPPYQLV